ncbi:MAG: Gfo/Idh/MocA family protein, partial [Planctomycetaceae bacterium]
MPEHSLLVIGCGGIGERHVRCLLRTGRARVTACDADAGSRGRMAATYGVPVAADAHAAIASGDLAAVVICTPAHTHVQLARAALAAGRHVLSEKPLSTSLDGVAELIAARDRTGRQAAVAYVYHVFPFLVAAREFINRREFGPVREVTAVSGQCYPAFR